MMYKTLRSITPANGKLFILSGRTSDCREDTKKWLNSNSLLMFPDSEELLMRDSGDSRKDSIIKKELYDTHIKGKYNVLGVFDDRNQVVDLWRSEGLTCFQVGYGYF